MFIPSVELVDRIQAIHTILTADVRALPIAWADLCRYYGRPPLRLDAWANAIDDVYRWGF
jgi:hypothetical protein